jgi:aromatic-L-amino-acid decarboxylase
MLEKIKALEKLSRTLEPTTDLRDHWNEQIKQYADHFLDVLTPGKTYKEDNSDHSLLDFKDAPKPIEELIQYVQTEVDDTGINPASSKHFGYIPGGGLFTTALGDYMAAATNRYTGISYASPGGVRMENHLIRWMCQLMGYPDTALGNLTSGGSIANLIAVVTARDHAQLKARDYEKACIYLTEHVHHCVQKALRIAGMSEAPIRYVPVTADMKMNTHTLKQLVQEDLDQGMKPFLIVGSAGTTNTGVIDPLDEMADVAEQHQLWFHVDAAYGGFFMMVDELRSQFRGIERSDSITIDPHKGLFISYGLGAVLVKNVQAVFESHHYAANYMQDAMDPDREISPADVSPELTKHFRGLRMWLSMHLYGLDALRAAIEEKVLLCRYFYEKIQKLGFEVGPPPELSVMIYRYVPEEGDADAFNEKLVKFVHDDGRVFVSSTTIDGVYWIRMAVMSFRTHIEEVDLCLAILKEGAAQVRENLMAESGQLRTPSSS